MVCGVKMKHAICTLALTAVLGMGMGVPCAAQEDNAPAETMEGTQETAAPKALSLGAESAKDKEAAKQLRALLKDYAGQGKYNELNWSAC